MIAPTVLIRGAGEMASAVAWRLHRAHIGRICMLDLPDPLAVRRTVAFSPALYTGRSSVEGVEAVAVTGQQEIQAAWAAGQIAVMQTTDWQRGAGFPPAIVIDAILAKRNLGTRLDDAALVIALGPGFTAGHDAHLVIETHRGHHLGRILDSGCAVANTGEPGPIAGYTHQRVLRAPVTGLFTTPLDIGDAVREGDEVGRVDAQPLLAGVDGVLRGLLRTRTQVRAGLKLGDIDPRGEAGYCHTISDKARALSGSVLECVMRHCNRTDVADR